MPVQLREKRLPAAVVRLAGGAPQLPVPAELGGDAVLGAEASDVGNGLRRRPGEPARLVAVRHRLERQEVRPQPDGEAAIAPARTGSADVSLDQDNIGRGFGLFEAKGRPQARITAAHDADVGAVRSSELRFLRGFRSERLVEPEASHGRFPGGRGRGLDLWRRFVARLF